MPEPGDVAGVSASQRVSIEAIVRFRDDLRSFQQMLLSAERPPEFAAFRQSLLHRAGAIRPLFERVVGQYLQPQPSLFGPPPGPPINVWDLALTPSGYYNTPKRQARYVGEIADHLAGFIGRLEADPSLLEPPAAPAPAPARAEGASQVINVHGGVVNIGQTHSGNVSQQASAAQDLTEIRRLLRELEEAIQQLEAPAEEREGFARPVAQLQGELTQDRPLVSRLVIGWGAVKAIGTTESAWQGWERAQRIAADVGPRLGELIQNLTN